MTTYTLKPGHSGFTITDGPDKGKAFRPGRLYDTVPPSHAHLFNSVQAGPKKGFGAVTKPRAARKTTSKDGDK